VTDQPPTAPHLRPKPHYFAGTFYVLLTIGAVVLAAQSSSPKLLLIAAVTAAYSVYLYRGGRWVVFFF
jgi:hypothetical protein